VSWLIPPPQATVKKTLCPVAHLDIEQDPKGSIEKLQGMLQLILTRLPLEARDAELAGHLVCLVYPEGLLPITLLINNKYLP